MDTEEVQDMAALDKFVKAARDVDGLIHDIVSRHIEPMRLSASILTGTKVSSKDSI